MIYAHFTWLDWLPVAAYGLYLIYALTRRRPGTEGYLIADRSLGLWTFTATLVATWYGGILGPSEFTYRYGLANWTTQGLPYYIFAILFAVFLATKVRAATLYTIPDKLEMAYGRSAALVGAVCAFLIANPATYVLMLGILISSLFGIPLLAAMIVGVIVSLVYVFYGGFQADVRINFVQFLLMFAGFALLLPFCWRDIGGFHAIQTHLPPPLLTFTGGNDWGYLIVWFFVALWTLVDPGFHQRCYAARKPQIARNGILLAVLCWFTFDCMTTLAGLYARVATPHLSDAQAKFAYLALAEQVLPPAVKGFFYVGLLAPVMSAMMSYTFIGAMTIGRDFVWRLKGDTNNDRIPLYTRYGLIVTALIATAIAAMVPSIVQQWFAVGTVFVPGLLIPLLTAYTEKWKVKEVYATLGIVAGSGVALACLLFGWLNHGIFADTSQFPFGIQPMYSGLIASLIVYLTGLLNRHHSRRLASAG